MLPWILCCIFAAVTIALTIKIQIMRKSMDEICSCLFDHISQDTNRLITVSSNDKHVRRLASEISKHLSKLRHMRQQYINGDSKLKEAVTNISHDLRTPLTAICGYLELLESEELTENAKRYISHISNRTMVLKTLTDEFFKYSIISSVSDLNYENVNISRVLEDTLISFYGAFKQKNITPQISIQSSDIVCFTDRSALSRIFENIVSNSVKYSDGDFSVTMTNTAKITFSNTSSELSPVDVGRLFDRFYTVDSAQKSTGLGLSIAKLLTERMGGTISADYNEKTLYITISFEDAISNSI